MKQMFKITEVAVVPQGKTVDSAIYSGYLNGNDAGFIMVIVDLDEEQEFAAV